MLLAINTTDPESTRVLLASFSRHPRLDQGSRHVDSRFRGNDKGKGGNDKRRKNNFKVIDKKVWGAGESQSEELLPEIDKMLKKHKINLNKKILKQAGDPSSRRNVGTQDDNRVDLIIVCKGPGSFTGTRVGISVANALSFGLKIPVVGVKSDGLKIEEIAEKGLSLYKKKEKIAEIVIPYYSKKPNIT